jgi:drug/metabolite transporter (DMT)-like permease
MSPDSAGGTRRIVLGLFVSLALVALWGSWPSLTRLGSQQLDWRILVMLRFGVPALLLLPVVFRIGLVPRGVPVALLALMVLTAGCGFFVLSTWALRLAPVAEIGPMLPGVPPLFVAVWAIFYEKRRFSTAQIAGFVLIGVGVFAIAGTPILQHGNVNLGHFLALGASLSWATYIIAYGRSGMSPLDATASVSLWSALLLAPFCMPALVAGLDAGQWREIGLQALLQGVAIGLVAILLFGASVRLLGAPKSAAFGAMTPVVSTALAIPVLGEWPSVPALVAIVAITAGVACTNLPMRTRL